ncbi:MAG: hypothetical protein V2G48_03425 [bacterium JZ-2024 1]
MIFGVSYYGSRHLHHIVADLKEIRKNGFSLVVWTLSEEDYWFYQNTLKEALLFSRRIGLQNWIDPWGWGGIFGGEAFTYWALRYPEATQKTAGKQILPALCPNHPLTLRLFQKWLDLALKCEPDAIFFDEPHFFQKTWEPFPENVVGCFCPYCEEKFRQQFYKELSSCSPEEFQQFHHQSILEFLDSSGRFLEENGSSSALCLLPDCPSKFLGSFAGIPSLKSLGTSPYYIHHKKPISWFESQVKNLLKIPKENPKVSLHIWIQAFRIPGGKEKEIEDAVDICASLGVETVLFWGFRACNFVSYLVPDHPQKVWNTILQTIQKHRIT